MRKVRQLSSKLSKNLDWNVCVHIKFNIIFTCVHRNVTNSRSVLLPFFVISIQGKIFKHISDKMQ